MRNSAMARASGTFAVAVMASALGGCAKPNFKAAWYYVPPEEAEVLESQTGIETNTDPAPLERDTEQGGTSGPSPTGRLVIALLNTTARKVEIRSVQMNGRISILPASEGQSRSLVSGQMGLLDVPVDVQAVTQAEQLCTLPVELNIVSNARKRPEAVRVSGGLPNLLTEAWLKDCVLTKLP